MENYQTPEGVRVPKALQPYMQGREFIPYNAKKVAAWNAKVAEEADGGKKAAKDKGAKAKAGGEKAKKEPKK